MTESATVARFGKAFDRGRLRRLADGLAVAVAVSLPWSVSATGILLALWALALLPTLDRAAVRDVLAVPAGITPVLLFAFALIGMSWSQGTSAEAVNGIGVFVRLLAVPLLLVHFARSDRWAWVVGGYLGSCIGLLALSWTHAVFPQLAWKTCAPSGFCRPPGIPVKDYIIQSCEFLLCAYGTVHLAIEAWQSGRHRRAVLLALLALGFLANIAFVGTGRSTLVIFAVLVLVLGFQRFGWRGAVAVVMVSMALSALAWTTSPYLRERVLSVAEEVQDYFTVRGFTSAGLRLEYWRKSVEIFAAAPVIGHGTGSTREMFRRAAVGETGLSEVAITDNPHNQILIVAIQLGSIGVLLLGAVWLAHALLFRGAGLIAGLGLGLVTLNIVAGLFNSYLFEFTLGWTYIFGVGVLGGTVLRDRRNVAAPPLSRRRADV
jgi:O-antigen ligase